MVNELEKFISVIEDELVNEVFFKYGDFEYQVSLCGRYIIVENTKNGDSEEFCFDATREELVTSFLNASPRGVSLRDMLSNLSEAEVIATD